MSTYKESSELSRINRSPSTDWVTVSNELLTVVEASLQVSRLSGGAFDVTVGPLVNLWGFGPEPRSEQVPTDEQIREASARVGFTQLHTRPTPPAIRKDRPDLYLDLSAVAQGYAADKVAAHLEAIGIYNYLVDVSGELRVKGRNARGEFWRIGIEKPLANSRIVQQVIQVSNRAMATSGDYRNFFEEAGRRFSHEIDPHTGRPVTHNLASVTVISASAMHADAMATALMVLGPEAGYQLAERENLAAFFLVKKNNGFVEKSTLAFRPYLAK